MDLTLDINNLPGPLYNDFYLILYLLNTDQKNQTERTRFGFANNPLSLMKVRSLPSQRGIPS